jgi:uncharacterized protein YjiS (DUF1127 family)
MSATLATIVRSQALRRPRAFSRLFSACWHGIERYFARRAAMTILREFDDRELRDIGITRSQIEAAVCGFTTLRPAADGMMASPAAIGPRAGGRRRASTMEAASWN